MMANRPAKDCANMDEVRAEIDRLDKALVDLVAERFTYVDRAWQLKDSPDQAVVPWRIQQVVDKVRAHAEQKRPAARTRRGAVAADDRLVHPV